MGSEAESADMFKCPVCNGNVKTGPDDDADERIQGFQAFLDKNKGMNKSLVRNAKVVENRLIYVPVWTAKVKADSYYKGYKTVQVPVQKTRTVRDSDGKTRTETYTDYETGYVPVQSELHTDTDERLLARKGARFYGLEDYMNTVDLGKTVPYDFEKIKDLDPTILNAEIGQEEYEKAIHGRVADNHRAQAASGLTELFDCRTSTNVRGTTYLQAPFSLIRYKFQGDLYKAAIDGHSGKVVLGEIPITKGQRIMWTLLGLIGIILAGAGGEFLYPQFIATEMDMTLFAIGLALALVGIVMTFLGFRVLIMTQRVKKG